MKDARPNPSTHLTLESLAEAAVSLQPPESSQAVVNLPDIELAESKDKQPNLKE